MAKKRPTLSDEESALFRRAMKGVRPLKYQKTVVDPPQPKIEPKTKAISRRKISTPSVSLLDNLADTSTTSILPEESLEFFRSGLQQRVIRKLRQGQFTIQARLDLHGKVVSTARQSLAAFLHYCLSDRIRYALIVHGKGKGSQQKLPILKNQVNHWLQQCDDVLAFCSAKPKDGGAGAVYVLLKGRGE